MNISSENTPIYAAFACALVALVVYIIDSIRKHKQSSLLAYRLYAISAGLTAYASFYLMQQILSCKRYDLEYIYSYSSPHDALIYRISSFWAGQEGSLLLWTLFTSLIGLVLLRKRSIQTTAVAAFWCFVQLFLLVLLIVNDPFKPLAGYQPGVIGVGLTPKLKNFWVATHPPILFLGYALLAVPSAFAVQALIKRDLREWAKQALPWTVLAWLFMTAGLILGMVWSYEALGWGGYWGWDPVENASLIPWLVSTALLHGLVVQKYRGRMAWTNICLALGTFLAVVYASFMTRSGVLAGVSVHSFAASNSYGYLLGFLVAFVVFFVGLVIARSKSEKPAPYPFAIASKDSAIIGGVIIFGLLTAVVLAGTGLSLFTKKTLQAPFYNIMSIPIGLAVIAFIVFASIFGWSRADMKDISARFSNALWKSGSHVAHLGVLLMILGMVFSAMGKSERVSLPENGTPSKAMGYEFSFDKWQDISANKAILNIVARCDGKSIPVPLTVEGTENGPVWNPHIISGAAGDVYISPGGMEQTIVTPTASLTKDGWMSVPVEIPNSNISLSLTGIKVESHAAMLDYIAPGKPRVNISVDDKQPTDIDGYSLLFMNFARIGEGEMGHSVGVNISIKGHGLTDRAVIEVSTKPFIWLLWLGMALITLGGLMATLRRYNENRRQENGILPDSV